jgi:hypothetical protein
MTALRIMFTYLITSLRALLELWLPNLVSRFNLCVCLQIPYNFILWNLCYINIIKKMSGMTLCTLYGTKRQKWTLKIKQENMVLCSLSNIKETSHMFLKAFLWISGSGTGSTCKSVGWVTLLYTHSTCTCRSRSHYPFKGINRFIL